MESFFKAILGDDANGERSDARIGIVMHQYWEGPSPGDVIDVKIVQPLDARLASVLGSFRTIPDHMAGGAELYELGIPEGHKMLRQALTSRPQDTQRILILVGEGSFQRSDTEMASYASRPKREGTRVMAICFYRNAQHRRCSTYEATVSVPADFIPARQPSDFPTAVAELTRRIIEPRIVAASVEHRMAPEVAAVPASDAPPASFVSRDDRMLRWDFSAPVPTDITTTYRIAPQVDSWRGTAVTTTLTVTDDVGFSRVLDVSTADLEITGPCAPTPTASATPTSTAVSSATPTPSPTATPTATPELGPIYLPLALHEVCKPGQQRIDVALVLDASTSMAEPTRSGRPKIEAAIEAASAFLDLLALDDGSATSVTGDQAAIVAFNADAWVLAPLTDDRSALDDALGAVALAPQTRLDRAVAVGVEALADSVRRRAGNQPVLVLLTDGRANPVPIETAVAEAETAKAAGVTVFTIGLGEDLDADGLAAMASSPEGFLRAPDGEDLAAAYAAVARRIPCPATAWWGGR